LSGREGNVALKCERESINGRPLPILSGKIDLHVPHDARFHQIHDLPDRWAVGSSFQASNHEGCI